MDEKKVREAIIYLKVGIEINKETIASMSGRFPTKSLEKEILNKETAIEALEKQLPKKVEYEGGFSNNGLVRYRMAKCPTCDRWYSNNDEVAYCPNCGQKLDWSESKQG